MKQEDQMKGSKVVMWCVILGAITLVAWLIASMLWLKGACSGRDGVPTMADTVIVVIHDTVTVVKPAPIEAKALPDMVVRLPRWGAPPASESDVKQACDSTITDAICPADSVDVMAPVEQKIYTDSTNYRAVISGAWVSLDTMEIYRQHEVATITKPPDRRR